MKEGLRESRKRLRSNRRRGTTKKEGLARGTPSLAKELVSQSHCDHALESVGSSKGRAKISSYLDIHAKKDFKVLE